MNEYCVRYSFVLCGILQQGTEIVEAKSGIEAVREIKKIVAERYWGYSELLDIKRI